jgi:SAM-dependent methyltransferase
MELDLLRNYPKPKRNLDKRLSEKTSEVVQIARKFGEKFFDGERKYGYGGFSYNPRYWTEVVKDFVSHYKLKPGSKVLDVGCAKGFMLFDLKRQFPEIEVKGIDISDYAIKNGQEEVKEFLSVGDATKIEFEDNYFDLVISINTVHNLDFENCKRSIQEISRVSKKNSFITVDAFNNEEEKERMYMWNLTAKTIMSVDDWKKTFIDIDYNGDYFWFIP